MSIQRHSEGNAVFAADAGIYARRDRQASVSQDEVADLLHGPSIHAGLLARHAVGPTSFGNPWHPQDAEDSGEYQGERDRFDDEWGMNRPDPSQHIPESQVDQGHAGHGHADDVGHYMDYDPHSSENLEGTFPEINEARSVRPHEEEFAPPPAKPNIDPREWDLPSFSAARQHTAGGLAIQALGVPPTQPAQMAEPVWLGHTFAPAHRVGMPWRGSMIPGTVTHLEGTEVGVRWDDGQHSVEEPSAIRPLY
jgi:hypothetical protein